jgi:hypothetical protein
MRRRLFIIGVIAVTAWILVLAGQRSLPTRPSPTPNRAGIITSDEFAKIRPGMSYQDCVRIIGNDGVPFGSSSSPDAHGDWPEWISYEWRNDAESFIRVSFHYGEVDRARAFNLK